MGGMIQRMADELLIMGVLPGVRLQRVLRLRRISISKFGMTEQPALMKLYLK
jgi:hypothetical protein